MTHQRAAIYCRVSTADQDCQRQLGELVPFAKRLGCEVVATFEEVASGAKDTRPLRAEVLALAQSRRVDVILVTELSRWGRSTVDLITTLHNLAGWGVSLVTMSGLSLDMTTPAGRLMTTVLAGMAEFERDLIRERIMSGLAAARARGKRLGRKPGVSPVVEKHRKRTLELSAEGRSQRWIAKELQISKNTVRKILAESRPTR